MGDRANIVLNQKSGSTPEGQKPQRIFLYTHWSGYELPVLLQKALAKRWRWRDEQYLGRIIFQAMLDGNDKETVYGISTRQGDGSYPLLVVDSDKQTVHLEANGSDDRVVTHGPWSFEGYIAMKLEGEGIEAWEVLSEAAPLQL